MAKLLKFSIVRRTIPLQLESEDGEVLDYVLQELDGTGRDEFIRFISSRTKMSADGKKISSDMSGMQSRLVSMHLHFAELEHVIDEATSETVAVVRSIGERIPEEQVKRLPSSLQSELFDLCQELSGLGVQKKDEEDEDAEKNF